MRGIPLRVEIGPKDMEHNQAVLVRRDNHEKTVVSLDELESKGWRDVRDHPEGDVRAGKSTQRCPHL